MLEAMKLIKFEEDPACIKKIEAKSKRIDPTKQLILFIEPYGAVLSLLKRAIDRGFQIVVFTADTDQRKVPDSIVNEVSLAIQVDTINEAKLRILVRLLRSFHSIDAVIAYFGRNERLFQSESEH